MHTLDLYLRILYALLTWAAPRLRLPGRANAIIVAAIRVLRPIFSPMTSLVSLRPQGGERARPRTRHFRLSLASCGARDATL